MAKAMMDAEFELISYHKLRYDSMEFQLIFLSDQFGFGRLPSYKTIRLILSLTLLDQYASKSTQYLRMLAGSMDKSYTLLKKSLSYLNPMEKSDTDSHIDSYVLDASKQKPVDLDSMDIPVWYYFIFTFKCGSHFDSISHYNTFRKWNVLTNLILDFMTFEFEKGIPDDKSLFWCCFTHDTSDLLDKALTIVDYAFCNYKNYPDITHLIPYDLTKPMHDLNKITTDPTFASRWKLLNVCYLYLNKHSPKDMALVYLSKISTLTKHNKMNMNFFDYEIIARLQRQN